MKKPLLIAGVVLSVILLNVLNLTPLLSPLLYTMTPLQRYYAADYLASSWHRDDPAATTETRTIWKARPDKTAKDKTGKGKAGKGKIEPEEFELAIEQDLLPLPAGKLIGTFSPEPFQLSEAAFAAGWIFLRRDNPHEVKSAVLADFLQREIFDGYPLWRFVLQPAFGLATLFFVWLVIRAWRKERWNRNMWNTRGKKNLSFLAWSVEVSDRMTKRWLPEPKAPEVLSLPPGRQLEQKVPAPTITVATSVLPSEPKLAAKPVAVQPSAAASPARNPVVVQTTIPITPAAPAKPKPVFVWDESQGID